MNHERAAAWWSTGSTVLLVVCAVVVTSLVVRRELLTLTPDEEAAVSFFADWEDLPGEGHRIGEDSAPVQMVVFFDYQCPYCGSLEPTIRRLREKYPDVLAVTYRHFLLERIHPQARLAALASECAAEQDRFAAMHRTLFENADRLGEIPWAHLAAEAGVVDTAGFQGCLRTAQYSDRIARDQVAFVEVGTGAVPTVIVNGSVVTGAKPFEHFERLVQDALDRP